MNNKLSRVKLINKHGMQVQISNFGARVCSIKLPVNGQLTEMTVPLATDEQVLSDDYYLGATCGPVCNRIKLARFVLNHKTYALSANDGDNCLHGGVNNLSVKQWNIESATTSSVILKLSLPDLYQGFPGNRVFMAKYTLTDDNRLEIEYSALTDKDTVINLTNHTYFNLGEENVFDLNFCLDSDAFLERCSDGLPTGELIGTDLMALPKNNMVNLKTFINNNCYEQVVREQGVDHCFVLGQCRQPEDAVAKLHSAKTGVKMAVFSDQPAMQFYTGKYLANPYQGLCFESQGYTDAVNHCHFPSIAITQEQPYYHKVAYQFN